VIYDILVIKASLSPVVMKETKATTMSKRVATYLQITSLPNSIIMINPIAGDELP